MRSGMSIAGDPAIELVGKCLAVALGKGRRPAGFDPGAAQFVEQVAHRESLVDRVAGVELAPRVEGDGLFGDHGCGERNVGSDYQIAGRDQPGDLTVGHVETGIHMNGPDVW